MPYFCKSYLLTSCQQITGQLRELASNDLEIIMG